MKQLKRVIPKYCKNIIVAVIYKHHFDWYVTPKELWLMDYGKLYNSIFERFENPNINIGTKESFFSKRFGIEILDSKTAGKFLSFLMDCRHTAEELKFSYAVAPISEKNAFTPSLLVDFDNKVLYSFYAEKNKFELLVPDNWTGIYEDFTSKIPFGKRFKG